jgi:hypothetical protein
MTTLVLAAIFAVLGFLVGEVFDVWYDSTHAEGAVQHRALFESIQTQPRRPLAFGYAKLWFREVLATPDAFEHYHWGLWLAANAVTMYFIVPEVAFLMLGVAVSLIMDENRNGIADEPFGLGKPYFATCTLIGVLLLLVLILRILVVTFMFGLAVVAFTTPFAILSVLYAIRWASS